MLLLFELTELAASMATRVHECVLDLEDLLDTTQPFDPASDARAFRISASDYAVLLLFGPIMQRLSEFAPNISIADDHAARLGRERRIVASTASFTAAPFLLSGTPLLAIVPRRLGERMRVAADLRLLELPFAIPPLREKLAWNPRVTTSPAHAWMRTLIVEVAAAL